VSNWYMEYCRDNKIPIQYGKNREHHERMLRRSYKKARKIEDEDLSSFKSREEAEEHLNKKYAEMSVGMTGIELLILQSILGWLIKKLLDRVFS
jgi:hypothetical protein